MNIVTIDPSLVCTAVVVNDKKFAYVGKHIATTKGGKLTRWFELFDGLMTLRTYDVHFDKKLKYSDIESAKLKLYSSIIDQIIADISSNLRPNEDTIIGIEGYSFSSKAGPLIDLVTFGTILRYSLLRLKIGAIYVVAPQELKSKSASLVYPEIKKGKVTRYKNNNGVSAGSFKKQDMMLCMLEDQTLTRDEWVNKIREHSEELLKLKTTPKPLEDINDAKLLYEWFVRNK